MKGVLHKREIDPNSELFGESDIESLSKLMSWQSRLLKEDKRVKKIHVQVFIELHDKV